MSRHHCIVVLLVVVTIAVFWPVQEHGFVWDDRINVYENPHLNSERPPDILFFWQKPYQRLYVPLTYTLWATIARFAKSHKSDDGVNLDPRPFHIANLVLHILGTIVVFTILHTLVGNDLAACAGALLFALHPVQVESVAWITGMKDVLCGFLSLVAVWQYVNYASRTSSAAENSGEKGTTEYAVGKKGALSLHRGQLHYAMATLAFVLALLAKPTAVVVPAMAWLLDYWVLRRSLRQTILPLVVWLVIALPFVLLTQWAQPEAVIHFITPLWARPLVAGDAIAFYLYKLTLPIWLGPDYGREPQWVLGQWWVYLAWMVPCGLLGLTWLWKNRRPWLLVSAGIFMVGVLPVSGLVPFSFQYVSTVADRYLYLSMVGPALALAWFLSEGRGRVITVVCVLILAWLGVTSAVQVQAWHDAERLWKQALSVNSQSSSAHYNLGNILAKRGEANKAIEHYRQAVRIDPGATDILNNLGNILVKQGKLAEAMRQYRRAVEINPTDEYAHYNLGKILLKQGKLEGAIKHLRRVVELNPADGEAHYDLGRILAQRGELKSAMDHLRKVLELSPPRNPDKTHFLLATVLAKVGHLDEAVKHYQQALKINPDFAQAHHYLGVVLTAQGNPEKAVPFFRNALRIEPEFAEAHEGLGQSLTQLGRRDEAIQHLEEALRILKSRTAASPPR